MAKPVHQMTIAQWEATFPDDDACKAYLAANRWSEGVSCPRCGNTNVYRLDKDWHWQCHACAPQGYRFSVLVGTVFENTKVSLRTWFRERAGRARGRRTRKGRDRESARHA